MHRRRYLGGGQGQADEAAVLEEQRGAGVMAGELSTKVKHGDESERRNG